MMFHFDLLTDEALRDEFSSVFLHSGPRKSVLKIMIHLGFTGVAGVGCGCSSFRIFFLISDELGTQTQLLKVRMSSVFTLKSESRSALAFALIFTRYGSKVVAFLISVSSVGLRNKADKGLRLRASATTLAFQV